MLLIDEIDRADEEFEAFLLEVLSDFQITIPEIGTIRAVRKPSVVLTSNRTRELHDALKRRCLYHWIGHPSTRARDRDRARCASRACPSGSPRRRRAFVRGLRGARPRQAAGRGGDDRLGARARRARAAGARRRGRRVHARLGAEVPRGLRGRPRRPRSCGSSRRRAPPAGSRGRRSSSGTSSPSAACCARPGSRSAPAGSRTRSAVSTRST